MFIYNKILVWVILVGLSIFVSIYPCWIILLTFYTFHYRCVLFLHLPHSSLLYLINPYSRDDKRQNLQRQ
jgi:hypothetical protein